MIYDLRFTNRRERVSRVAFHVSLLAILLFLFSAQAFPPAPHHVIHGTVRDEVGNPISLAAAQVFLETANGVSVSCPVSPQIQPGENYRLLVPMDSITSPDAYKPTALHATIPFRLRVNINGAIYLPLEMTGNLALLGKPAGETLINLTLGVDSDGDGLPDAWERLLIQMMGNGMTLADITRNGDSDGDGISNYDEYVAGTYPFDPEDGLKLSFVLTEGQGPVVQFFGIAGRTYSVQGTTNLVNWTTVSVRVPPGNLNASGVQEFYSATSKIVETEVLLSPDQPKALFYRVRVK